MKVLVKVVCAWSEGFNSKDKSSDWELQPADMSLKTGSLWFVEFMPQSLCNDFLKMVTFINIWLLRLLLSRLSADL